MNQNAINDNLQNINFYCSKFSDNYSTIAFLGYNTVIRDYFIIKIIIKIKYL